MTLRARSLPLLLCCLACGTHENATSASHDATVAVSSQPVDKYGYAIVGVDVFPPLYERVEAKCVPAFVGVEPVEPGCDEDDDCGAGFACICGTVLGGAGTLANQCVPAECRSSRDCGSGKCLFSQGNEPNACCDTGHLGLVCSRSTSTCQHGGDCVGNGRACRYDEALDHFECKTTHCPCP